MSAPLRTAKDVAGILMLLGERSVYCTALLAVAFVLHHSRYTAVAMPVAYTSFANWGRGQ